MRPKARRVGTCAALALLTIALVSEDASAGLDLGQRLAALRAKVCNFIRRPAKRTTADPAVKIAVAGSDPVLRQLCSGNEYWMRQQVEELEVAVRGLETPNRYTIFAGDKASDKQAFQVEEAAADPLKRQFFGTMRPLTFEFKGEQGNTVFKVDRPFHWLKTKATVTNGQGELIGSLQQMHARVLPFLSGRYSLRDGDGKEFARVKRRFMSIFRPRFDVVGANGEKLGTIKKSWGGWLRELFSTADNFCIQFAPNAKQPLTAEQRAICLSAVALIDVGHFDAKASPSSASDDGGFSVGISHRSRTSSGRGHRGHGHGRHHR